MGCLCSFHQIIISETVFELGAMGTSTFLRDIVRKPDGTLAVRKTIKILELKCTKCGRNQQVYLKHTAGYGWKMKSSGKYTAVGGVLTKNF